MGWQIRPPPRRALTPVLSALLGGQHRFPLTHNTLPKLPVAHWQGLRSRSRRRVSAGAAQGSSRTPSPAAAGVTKPSAGVANAAAAGTKAATAAGATAGTYPASRGTNRGTNRGTKAKPVRNTALWGPGSRGPVGFQVSKFDKARFGGLGLTQTVLRILGVRFRGFQYLRRTLQVLGFLQI